MNFQVMASGNERNAKLKMSASECAGGSATPWRMKIMEGGRGMCFFFSLTLSFIGDDEHRTVLV